MASGQSMAHAWLMGTISLSRYRQSARYGPSRANCSGGFFVVRSKARSRTSGEKPERETRIPGLALEKRVPKRAGPVGGNEGDEPDTDDRANPEGSQIAARHSRRRGRTYLVCRTLAAQPTLVVKISDTSYQWKERVRIPPVKSRTVERPDEGIRMRHGFRRPSGWRELNH